MVRIFLGRDGNGKRKFRNRVITGTKKDAQRWAIEAERDRDAAGTGAQLHTLKVDALLDDLLADYKANGKDYVWAEQVVRLHLRPAFGGTVAAKLSTTDVRKFTAMRQKEGAANATINRALALLKRSFNLGAESTPPTVQHVPFIPMLKEKNTRQGFFEDADYRALLRALPVHLQPLLCFAYYTGCRRGEIFSLKWRQVDLNLGTVRLEAWETKNGEARTIPLVPELREMLAAQKARFPNNPLVFCDESGEAIKSLTRPWAAACKTAGLVDATGKPTKLFHDCRRTGVRNLVRAGVPEKVVMAVSGHKTRSIFDRYNIVSESDMQDAAAKLSDYTTAMRRKDEAETGKKADPISSHTIVTPMVN